MPVGIYRCTCHVVADICKCHVGSLASLLLSQAAEQIKSLYRLFCGVDATQVEINPLGETREGKGQSTVLETLPALPRVSKTCAESVTVQCITLCSSHIAIP